MSREEIFEFLYEQSEEFWETEQAQEIDKKYPEQFKI